MVAHLAFAYLDKLLFELFAERSHIVHDLVHAGGQILVLANDVGHVDHRLRQLYYLLKISDFGGFCVLAEAQNPFLDVHKFVWELQIYNLL